MKIHSALVLPLFFSLLPALPVHASEPAIQARIHLILNCDEPEAVLALLEKRASKGTIVDSDWERIFRTQGYIRLKQREASMHVSFSDEDFKKFTLSPELAARAPLLRRTLEAWKNTDLTRSAERVLAYLPQQAVIHATVFPVIKPKTNSFVFDTNTDPAIFLYIDPAQPAAKFENTVAHELHHIGYASIESIAESRQSNVPPDAKAAVDWMGAFGEGFAMLAAAGSPDVDPHAASSEQERARWKHDLANFNQDLMALQQFFLDSIEMKLGTKDKVDEKGFSFFGDAQGPWYTVGYKMSVLVERRFGRRVLIDCMLDPRLLLVRYNEAAGELNRTSADKLALWSPSLLERIGAR